MIRKDKIFELKIEEEDELSGIDSISLVDEPAIEVNWVAFNKVKPEEFHIPDGEDDNYLEKLSPFGQDEQSLFDEGFEIDKIEYPDSQDFITSYPNRESDLDTNLFRIRYKYVLNPKAGGAPISSTTRKFCADLIRKNLVFRLEDMVNQQNDQGSSFADWRGGYNCRHLFARIIYKKRGEIENDAAGKRPDGYDILGDPQNDTRVPEWPSFSKVSEFDYLNPSLPPYVDQVSGETISKSLTDPTTFADSYSDYPDSVKNNAKAVLKYVEENGWGSCGTDVGKQRANQLAKGEAISLDTVKRMYSYLSRHEKDLESSKGYGDGCGKLMYDSWGGKSAIAWAKSKINQAEKMSKQYFQIDNEEKQIVLGPAMIPDQKIFRKDALGNPYYVFFSPETIKMIAEKYMKNKYIDNNDQMHDGKAVKDVYVIESWIKEDEHDKSSKYGFGDLPVGTWFVSMKVKNPEIWSKVKSGELNGFSVSGFFEEVASFSKEEMFLYKVAEVLKNIKE